MKVHSLIQELMINEPSVADLWEAQNIVIKNEDSNLAHYIQVNEITWM